jgi:hypothetical protein
MSEVETWVAAVRRLSAARAEELAYDRAVWTPCWLASKDGGPDIPDEVDAELERLTEDRCAAEDTMVATPSPRLSGTVYKIEYARIRWEESDDWPPSWWEAVMTDLRRFAAQETS